MAERHIDTTLFDRAATFAVGAHSGTERRGKGFPYVIHCMEAAAIVSTLTNDPELLAAAMLHDVIEDTDVTEKELRREFGPRVASLVSAESDPAVAGPRDVGNWRARKKIAMERLAKADRDTKTVAIGDKLSNMRAIARDYEALGDGLWERFRSPDRADHEWHYRTLAAALSDLEGTDAYREFTALIEKTFGPSVPETDPEGN